MPKFSFTAVDAKGKEAKGLVEADNEDQVMAMIREKGFFPTGVSKAGAKEKKKKKQKEKDSPKISTKAKSSKKGKGMSMEINLTPAFMLKVKPKELMVFTRQLSTLVDAGLPLVRGLEVLERQNSNTLLKRSILDMIDSINAGSTFAEALMQHPKIFDKLYVNMVKAGEMGGVLDKVLSSLAEFMEKMQKIKNKVVSAMVYPSVVMFMAMSILAFLMIFIIPRFEKIFEDILNGKALPLLTRVVIGISDIVTGNIILVAIVIAALVVTVQTMGKTEKGRLIVDMAKLKAPIFGSLLLKVGISRFCRTLGTLMDSGVPVLQALQIVGETSGNAVLARSIHDVHDAVKEGENIAPPMEATKVFPPMVISMIEVGEETGELPQMLSRIADSYEDEVDNAVAAITSIIEPILIIFLALIVGTIVIALFLPLITLITELSA